MPGLSLGSDKEDVTAGGDGLLDELSSSQESLEGLANVDDVNHVPFAVDIGGHFGIPSRNAMTEMNAGVHQ